MRTVVAPEAAGLCVTSKVKGRELHVADGELFGGGMESRLTGSKVSACKLRHDVMVALQNSHPVVLEHVKKPVYVSGRFSATPAILTWSFQHCLCIRVSFVTQDGSFGWAHTVRERAAWRAVILRQQCT
jgi:hypothetical protein